MPSSTPRYLLLTEGGRPDHESHWRFMLQGIDSSQVLSASDSEPQADTERAELLAVVRGLEALEEPAWVTLVTRSRYVQQGFARGLQEWRDSGWHWERFGRIVPVRDHDLWQRVDHALAFHQVECRCWRFDDAAGPSPPTAHPLLGGPHFVRPRRSNGGSAMAACSATTQSDPRAARKMQRRNRNRLRRPTKNRWVAGAVQHICTTAARAVSAPLAAS